MQFLVIAFVFLFSNFAFAAENPEHKTPNFSLNTLFLYKNSNFHKENTDPANPDSERNGFGLREAELQFHADVDSYTRLNLLLAVHPEYESNGTEVEEKWHFEPEEVFVESKFISSATFKLGKFKASMGPHNLLHTHEFAFIKAPLANELLLGDEGLNDFGASVAVRIPASWQSELSLQYLRGEGENSEFNSPSPSDGVGLLHWKNLWNLSEDLNFELGLSYAQGPNALKKNTTLSGADLTFKWRPQAGSRQATLIWSTELLSRTQESAEASSESGQGIASWLQYQFTEHWAALYRFDTLKVSDSLDPAILPNDTWERHSAGLKYRLSEFSSLKVEYNQRRGGPASATGENTEKSVFLQASFTIENHPDHHHAH